MATAGFGAWARAWLEVAARGRSSRTTAPIRAVRAAGTVSNCSNSGLGPVKRTGTGAAGRSWSVRLSRCTGNAYRPCAAVSSVERGPAIPADGVGTSGTSCTGTGISDIGQGDEARSGASGGTLLSSSRWESAESGFDSCRSCIVSTETAEGLITSGKRLPGNGMSLPGSSSTGASAASTNANAWHLISLAASLASGAADSLSAIAEEMAGS